jgi:hypothetical protein
MVIKIPITAMMVASSSFFIFPNFEINIRKKNWDSKEKRRSL